MKTKDTDTTMITSTEKATDKVARAFYSSMDEMLAHDFEDMKKIATTPTKKTPAYVDPKHHRMLLLNLMRKKQLRKQNSLTTTVSQK